MAIRGSSLAGVTIPLGGPAGLPGQSAYAAWLQLGNAGSLAAFIASLKGDPGGVTTLAGKIGALGLDDINALAKNGDASNATATAGGATERLGSVYARVVNYASRAAAAAAVIPAVMVQVTLGGYAVQGDGGDARYVAVATQPTHLGKFQSADGRWWAIAEKRLRPEMFGGAGDDTTDNLGPVNAAMGVFAYQNTGGPSGGQIEFLGASYAFSGSVSTNGRHGLGLFGGGINRSQLRATGNFPVFVDIGTATSGTAEVEIAYMKIVGGGKNNANAHGIQWNYSYNGKIHDVFFYGCNHCLDLSNSWQVNLTRLRGDGQGSAQSNVGLYMAEADPNNPVINNAVIAIDCSFYNNVQWNFRLINFQGSLFIGCQGGGGDISWYLGDPTTGTAVVQWGHFINCLGDTVTGRGWLIKKGNAAALSQMEFSNCWSGNVPGSLDGNGNVINGVGLEIDGATDVTVDNMLIISVVTGVKLINCSNCRVDGLIRSYNRASNGSGAVSLIGSSDNTISFKTSTQFAVVGYNGYVEDAASFRNSLYGFGQATAAMSLQFGGASTGITYAAGAQSAVYEVVGRTVRIQYYFGLTSKGTATGGATLAGLPFPAIGGAAGYGGMAPFIAATGVSGITSPYAQTGPGSTSLVLAQQGATGANQLTDANFGNGAVITGSIPYLKQ